MSVEEDDVACLRLDIVLVVPHTLSDKVSTQVIYKTVSRDNAAAQVACFIGHERNKYIAPVIPIRIGCVVVPSDVPGPVTVSNLSCSQLH